MVAAEAEAAASTAVAVPDTVVAYRVENFVASENLEAFAVASAVAVAWGFERCCSCRKGLGDHGTQDYKCLKMGYIAVEVELEKH